MADVIKVSTDELRTAVDKYTAQKTQLQIAYLQMSNAIRQLDTTYNGDASEVLKSQFDQMYSNIEQTDAKVQDAITELIQTADIMQEVESGLQTAFGNLQVGTSPFDI